MYHLLSKAGITDRREDLPTLLLCNGMDEMPPLICPPAHVHPVHSWHQIIHVLDPRGRFDPSCSSRGSIISAVAGQLISVTMCSSLFSPSIHIRVCCIFFFFSFLFFLFSSFSPLYRQCACVPIVSLNYHLPRGWTESVIRCDGSHQVPWLFYHEARATSDRVWHCFCERCFRCFADRLRQEPVLRVPATVFVLVLPVEGTSIVFAVAPLTAIMKDQVSVASRRTYLRPQTRHNVAQ